MGQQRPSAFFLLWISSVLFCRPSVAVHSAISSRISFSGLLLNFLQFIKGHFRLQCQELGIIIQTGQRRMGQFVPIIYTLCTIDVLKNKFPYTLGSAFQTLFIGQAPLDTFLFLFPNTSYFVTGSIQEWSRVTYTGCGFSISGDLEVELDSHHCTDGFLTYAECEE